MITFARWTVALDVLVKSALEVMESAEVAAKLDIGVSSVTTLVNLVMLMDAIKITGPVYLNACLVSMDPTVHKAVVQRARTADAIAPQAPVLNVRMAFTENDAISIAAVVV